MYIFHVTFNQLKVFTVDFQTYQYTTSAFQYSLTVFLCTSLLFLLPIAHILKSSCNIMHNSLTDVGRTDVTSFCQGIHSFTMPNVFFFFFFSVVCGIFLLGWVFIIFKHANLSHIHYLNISKFYQSPWL